MKSLKLKDDLYWLGALDPNLRIFDIIMYTEFGTTYNAYLIKGNDKIALIETVKVKFFDEYIEKLKQYIKIEDINYIVLNHTEPDHAGSVEKLMQLAPNAKLVGSRTALEFMAHIGNQTFPTIEVKEGDTIDLGGKTLSFIAAPFLHWPDSMYTYCKEDKVLFTCDSFGAHYCFDEMLLSQIQDRGDYYKAYEYYFNMIFGPFKKWMLEAISKIELLEIDMICNGHGPVLDKNPMEIVDISKKWCQPAAPLDKKIVVIPYVSAYGYTGSLAEAIGKGIQTVEGIEVQLYDMVYANKDEVLGKIAVADGLLFGSPTINGDMLPPIRDLLTQLSPIVHNDKLAAGFGSYGWSGEAVPNIENRLLELRMKAIPGLRIRFKPSNEELVEAEAYGKAFAELIMDPAKEIPVLSRATFDADDRDDVDGTNKLWRCIICGEIYEGVEPPRVCPACGAASAQFEVYISDDNGFKSSHKDKFVIVGGNAAGIAAAEAIRKRNPHAYITIIDKDPEMAYYRPVLSDYIRSRQVTNTFYLHDKTWYVQEKITLKLGIEVKGIDKTKKQLQLSDGTFEAYDKLILATGATNFIPPFPKVGLEGVFSIRTKEDADKIIEYSKNAQRVVVVGGGLLGLEAAWEFKELGYDTTVLEVAERILPRQLDEEGSLIFEKGIDASGVVVRKGVKVIGCVGDERVTGVALENGEVIAADLVLVSIGIRANTTLAQSLGLEINRGIVVDCHMRTSESDIFAAGDCAEFEGINYGIWPEAIKQGMTAGINAVGDVSEYQHFIPSNIFNGMNMNIISVGDYGTDTTKTYQVVSHKNPEELTYKKLYFVDNQCVGGIIIGDINKSGKLIKGVEKHSSMEDMISKILV